MEKLPSFLKPYFWDVDFENLTVDKNPSFVTLRVIDRGNTPALKWVLSHYGLKTVKEIVLRSREISRKTAFFWIGFLGLDPRAVVCLNKPYSPIPFAP